ncbi:MAG TPA: nucleoside hydrolase-like domain-containing protein [Prolixibacteraceae bacterium]|nr:nucleoside hydrolase-like domain-containing protein [Prolixibacteraceae bacterium]
MKRLMNLICVCFLYLGSNAQTALPAHEGPARQAGLQFEAPVKQRLFVLTDITNEPDDQESLVRLLVYSNEYDLEGIVATTSTHLRKQVRKDKVEQLVRNYGQVKPNLDKHAQGYPSMEYLLSITSEHLPLYSMEGVGQGKDSPGSDLLIRAVDKADDRPLWITAWGGANCLAQALWKVRETRSEEAVRKFISKIKVYSISDQDFAGQWMRTNFPELFYIVDPSAGDSWLEYYKATWTGISGDRFYKNGPGMHNELVDNPWLAANIRENHGPLGANYLKFDYIMEGDTPSFLGLINNGLGWYISPALGGWGGRYEFYQSYAEKGKIWTSSVNTLDEILLPDGRKEASNQATIWRWREAYQHDFAARMDWNIAGEYKKANHNPVLSLNGNTGKAVARAHVKAGEKVQLSAKGSSDPDGNQLSYHWFIYREAGAFTGSVALTNADTEELAFTMPEIKKGQELHVILEVRDSGTPSLFSYRRVILTNP